MSHQTATPSHWDLHLACCAQSLAMAAKYYSLLVQYDPVNPTQIVGDMARSWDVSDDGLSYTFHLHPADFNDGTPVTSQDWKFSIDRMIEPDEPRPRAGLLRPYIKDSGGDRSRYRKSQLKIPSSCLSSVYGSGLHGRYAGAFDCRATYRYGTDTYHDVAREFGGFWPLHV